MHALRAAIAQRPIPAYIAIAFAFSWATSLSFTNGDAGAVPA